MKILNIFLYYFVILPISRLPLSVLYGFSDVLFFVFFHLTGYRKKIVSENLKGSFPEKNEVEIQRLMKLFYHHFADLIVESLRIFSISEEEAKLRMKYTNPEILDKDFQEGRTIILAGGHYNNWEILAVTIAGVLKHTTIGLYKPLNNKFFDEKMRQTREKYGLNMISTKKTTEVFNTVGDKPAAIIFGADQSPSRSGKGYWLKFLNRDTLVLFGTEKYAKEFNCPVYYGAIKKVKRGYYETTISLLTDNPRNCAIGEITEMHTKMLEDDIRRQPEYWLWTHKRWKHKKE